MGTDPGPTPDSTDAIDQALPEAFSVHDAASANWVIRSIGEARQYGYRIRRGAKAELRRAERQEQFFLQR